MNQSITKDFIACEVSLALKQMYPLKAPGPNAMPLLFFQHFWPKVGKEVTRTVLDFLNSGIVPPNFNEMWCLFLNVKSQRKLLIVDQLVYVMWCIKLLRKLLLTD